MRIPVPQFLHPRYGVVLDATLTEMSDIWQVFVGLNVGQVPPLSCMKFLLGFPDVLGQALLASDTVDYVVTFTCDVLFYVKGCGCLCNVGGGAEFTMFTRITPLVSTLMESNSSIVYWMFLLVCKGHMN